MYKIYKKTIIIFVLIILMFNCSYSATNHLKTNSTSNNKLNVKNNREPRIVVNKTNKDYLTILLHDEAGIKLEKTSIKFEGKEQNISLIKSDNGVYDKNGKRIADLSNSSKYTGAKYDYGIKIKYSSLDNKANKSITIDSYDYGGKCYLSETCKAHRLDKADKDGYYYRVNLAPRTTTKLIDGILNIYSEDNSGIKNIVAVSDKTGEKIFEYNAEKDNIGTLSKSIKLKENNYPNTITKELSLKNLEKAKISENMYKIRVTAEDKWKVKSTKTMIVTLIEEKVVMQITAIDHSSKECRKRWRCSYGKE